MPKWKVQRDGAQWLMDSEGRVAGVRDNRRQDWLIPMVPAPAGIGEADSVPTYGLVPSGGDDGPAMAAMAQALRGLIVLGPGVFKVNSPQVLESFIFHDSTGAADERFGIRIVGAGMGVTVVDTSGAGLACYQRIAISTINANASPTITLVAGEVARVGGIAVTDQLRAEIAAGNMRQINHSDFIVAAVAGDVLGPTTAQFYTTGGLGSYALNADNYLKKYDETVPPVFRIITPKTGVANQRAAQQTGISIEGISFLGVAEFSGTTKRTQRLFAFETDEVENTAGGTTLDTRITHGVRFTSVSATGYEVVIHGDDLTGLYLEHCDFKGNSCVVWAGYNFDIFNALACHFGDDFGPASWAWGAAILDAPPAFRRASPGGTTYNAPSSNSIKFDTCWFMALDTVYQSSSQSGSFTIDNCYHEQVRKIGYVNGGFSVIIRGTKYTIFSDSDMFASALTVIGNSVRTRVIIEGNSGGANTGAFNGFLDVTPHVSAEPRWPSITWDGNSLGYPVGKGQIKTSATPTWIAISDNHAGEELKGDGLYHFEGPVQTGGRERIQVLASGAAITPDLNAGTTVWVDALAVNTTIGAPTNQNGFAASYAMRRMLPLRIVIKQDATGARTVAFNAIFKTNPANAASGAANTSTEYEFRWDGAAWRQTSPAAIWL